MNLSHKILSLLLMVASARTATASSFIPLSLGPDFQSPYSDGDILRGFKLNIAEGESPLRQHVFGGSNKQRPLPFRSFVLLNQIIE